MNESIKDEIKNRIIFNIAIEHLYVNGYGIEILLNDTINSYGGIKIFKRDNDCTSAIKDIPDGIEYDIDSFNDIYERYSDNSNKLNKIISDTIILYDGVGAEHNYEKQ